MTRREIAVVQSYDELIRALRKRADELKITRETIDAVTGLQGGYSAKLLASVPIRMLGRVSFGPILQCLGIILIVAEDPTQLERISRQFEKRSRPAAFYAGNAMLAKKRKRRPFAAFRKSPEFARLMRARQVAKQTPEKRSAIARIAAQARWARQREKLAAARRVVAA